MVKVGAGVAVGAGVGEAAAVGLAGAAWQAASATQNTSADEQRRAIRGRTVGLLAARGMAGDGSRFNRIPSAGSRFNWSLQRRGRIIAGPPRTAFAVGETHGMGTIQEAGR